jgi:site-specific recombinase XerD
VLNRFCDSFHDRSFESISTEELNDFVVHLKKSGMQSNTVLHNVVIIAQFFKRNGRSGIMRQLQLPERSVPLPK